MKILKDSNNHIFLTQSGSALTLADTEERTVDLSFAEGASSQVVLPSSSGKTMSQVTINKPATLIASNVKNGVVIANVTGTYALTLQERTASGNGVIEPEAEYDGLSKVTVSIADWNGSIT